jgi:hypothetical protein
MSNIVNLAYIPRKGVKQGKKYVADSFGRLLELIKKNYKKYKNIRGVVRNIQYANVAIETFNTVNNASVSLIPQTEESPLIVELYVNFDTKKEPENIWIILKEDKYIVEEWLEELEDKKWLKSAANTREGQRLSTTKIKGIWHGLTWKQKIIAAALVLSAILSSIAATIGSTQTVIKIFQF